MGTRTVALGAVAAIAVLLATSGCASTAAPTSSGRILAVGAENQYTSVISQIGGRYVEASSVMSNPNTDPHTFEASAQVAAEVSSARLIVQNGLGYDAFMSKIEAASAGNSRVVITAQSVLGLADSTRNPHLWYDPRTMPAVAKRIATSLSAIQPSHRAYFAANLERFQRSMMKVTKALAAFRHVHSGIAVATTEPVADYLLKAAGVDNLTPWSLQAAIMNDTDPAPQDVAIEQNLLTNRRVSAFLYNRQVTDSVTSNYLKLAKTNGIPVVAVYETMPTDGFSYQTWMLAELDALAKAVEHRTSTAKL